jgi:hypothetical protein
MAMAGVKISKFSAETRDGSSNIGKMTVLRFSLIYVQLQDTLFSVNVELLEHTPWMHTPVRMHFHESPSQVRRYKIFVDLCGGVRPIFRAAWLNPLLGALEREALAFLRKRGDF